MGVPRRLHRGVARGLASLLPLLPAVACAARVAEGPAADQVREGIASGRGSFDHGTWDALLQKHVDSSGRVDYAGLARQRGRLDGYLDAVGGADLATLSRDELMALLINAYNACTVRLILDAASGGELPASIKDVEDPWGRKVCTVGGHALSLDTIEHGLLRPLFRDTRVHAAVNCASRSCPSLAPRAFRGDRLEAQLQEQAVGWMNDPDHARVEDGRLRVSKILDWYGGDFVGSGFAGAAPNVAEYVRRLAEPGLRRRIEALGPAPRVEFLDYDWSLNGRGSTDAAH